MKIIKRSYRGVGFGKKGVGHIKFRKYDKPLPYNKYNPIEWIKKLFKN